MIESASDLAGFFNTAEFADSANIQMPGKVLNLSGIFDSIAVDERPGSNSNSSSSPWLAGAADVVQQGLFFSTAYQPDFDQCNELTLAVLTGDYVGNYRIKKVMRDGAIARLQVNKR